MEAIAGNAIRNNAVGIFIFLFSSVSPTTNEMEKTLIGCDIRPHDDTSIRIK